MFCHSEECNDEESMISSFFCGFLVAFKISETSCCRFLAVFPLALLRIIFGAAAGIALCVSCPKKVLYTEPFTFHLSSLPFLRRQLHTRSDRGHGSLSVWFVDSAVRWRRNGVGGLKKIVVRLRLFDCWFLVVLQFAELREPQPPGAEARRFGFRRARTPQAAFASFIRSARCLGSQTQLRSASRVEASGASVCEPPRGGASALAWLKPVFAIWTFASRSTTIPISNLRCRQLHIPVCCGAENNSEFTIQNAQFVILRSIATKNLYADDIDV